ncbi:hypothetical protein EWM64_g10593 [Hericium alpestre]|uniref:NADH:flavin oxidoreductase/NADH oxidase N-terminal domain-containing protein n=1 Tax=Hericium alpestre TaxID=135208 RepID=A0A4Y9ZGW7_9AGAM|nr:hypothetical protein EWM64_g10593 [Hericium alpestre]
MPIFRRISATNWLQASLPNELSWALDDTVRLAPLLAAHGVDFLDISGGAHPAQKLNRQDAYQVPLSAAVKHAHGDKIPRARWRDRQRRDRAGHPRQGAGGRRARGPHVPEGLGAVWSFLDQLGVAIHKASQLQWAFKMRRPAPSAEKVRA